MNEAAFKSATKQFDLSAVYKLTMPRAGLRCIENLQLLPSLTELDLNSNKLKRIEGLDGLESLKRLVLSYNEIERIEGLDTCDALETLQMQGNRVSNLDDVQSLTLLPCLRHFQMQVRGAEASERNPMCDHPAYRTAVRRMLPQLQTLDGERCVIADAAVPQVADALSALNLPEPEAWLKDFDWDGVELGPSGQPESLGPLKGAPEFDKALTECKRLAAKAESMIEDWKAKTPR